MRQRLITVSNGHQEEYALKKMFNDFDSNGNGIITLDELAALMAHLQICCERKYLQALLSVLDKNKSGSLDYAEFAAFVIYDPYKWIKTYKLSIYANNSYSINAVILYYETNTIQSPTLVL